jgi:hypothetical protein
MNDPDMQSVATQRHGQLRKVQGIMRDDRRDVRIERRQLRTYRCIGV